MNPQVITFEDFQVAYIGLSSQQTLSQCNCTFDEDFQITPKDCQVKRNFDSQVTLKTSKSKLLNSQVSTNYQVTHMILKSSKSKTSKSPKDYQVEKIVSFELNSTTLKSSIALM